MALTAGTRLGPYEILAPIGAGGMGEMYRAVTFKPLAYARGSAAEVCIRTEPRA